MDDLHLASTSPRDSRLALYNTCRVSAHATRIYIAHVATYFLASLVDGEDRFVLRILVVADQVRSTSRVHAQSHTSLKVGIVKAARLGREEAGA